MTKDNELTSDSSVDKLDGLPLLASECVQQLGSTVVIAPHPDDESLGCGGLIALLRQSGMPVHVLVMSDGCGSHPASQRYPPDALRELRESEAVEAIQALGMGRSSITFMRLPDTCVPFPGEDGFGDAAQRLRNLLTAAQPRTVLIPWRRDPHTDHRATWHIVSRAIHHTDLKPRLIEYPIWIWDLGATEDFPFVGEMRGWRLDIATVLERKRGAIDAHRSQTTGLIADDPTAFRLTPETLARFRRPWETYLEPAGE